MQIKKQRSIIQEIRDEYQAELKRLKRRKFLLKARIILTVILPVFIILLSVKVIKTFIRIKVRSLFAQPQQPQEEKKTPPRPAVPVPAEMKPVEKEIVKPVPVKPVPVETAAVEETGSVESVPIEPVG
ncbi:MULTISPECIES: hypothetical protein [Hungatella]|uniref:Glycoside hydrolase family 23 n=1 Tax=Hungatella hathewayi TaxID=154046 RepID=A0AAW9WJ34_9FIRM|nr:MULTISPECIES: hypothetical protein [Hungatella]MCQ4828130.1 glycoside hydrolase family 23 [Hungatella sp. SL.1.14]MUB64032.1 glycoside hydrolase family 23 [Hungatella hathewayi]CUP88084.1 Uncharacterised protein [Hungatella hathewayi]